MRGFQGILVIALAMLVFGFGAAPARAEWKRAESERFIVYSDGDERALRRFVQTLEVYDRTLRIITNRPVDTPPLRRLPVYLVNRQRDIRTVAPNVGDTIHGLYVVSDNDIWAIAVRQTGTPETLLHEYAHHFMLQHFPQGYPAWFVEGFAEYFSSVKLSDGRVEVGHPNENAAYWLGATSNWVSMQDLLTQSYWDVTRGRETYYPAAWLLTHWMMTDPARRRQLDAYLNAVASGTGSVDAMEAAVGMPVDQLERSLRRYLSARAMAFRVDYPFPQVPVTVTAMPASAEDLLLLTQRLRSGHSMEEDEEQALLTQVRTAAARHPGDALATRALARAELLYGSAETAEALLSPLVQNDSTDVEALQLMAEVRMGQADEQSTLDQSNRFRGMARAFLARALAADDTNFSTYLLLSRTRNGASGFPSENDLETMRLAYILAPQLPDARFNYAQGLLIRGRAADAIAVLRPLMNDPHNPGIAQFAQQLTAEARERLAETQAPAGE